MNKVIEEIESQYMRKVGPESQGLRVGDTVRVFVKIKEGDKERDQVFEGIIIGQKRGGARATITVRKISHGVGVERIFPLHSPSIDKIEVKAAGQVRRAKLNYLRGLAGKAARVKERSDDRVTKKGE
ncbi:MAG: 50S ribosomal protein L19 [Deltaproteobacteria bacterium]|jgi:large subunit ribosomal protein L19|nr:50S ribosomal protein L19 [Deltaproteobacteria bacterium]